MKFRKINLGTDDPAIGLPNIAYAEGELEMVKDLFSFAISNKVITREIKNKIGNWYNLEIDPQEMQFVQCFKHHNSWVINFGNNKGAGTMWCCEDKEGLEQLAAFIKKYGVNSDLTPAILRDLHIDQILED